MPELLTNLKIIGTEKPADSLSLSVPMVFEVMFNPNSYTINNKINFDTQQAEGSEGSDPKFKNIAPESFGLEFMLDGTGVSKAPIPILAQVALFKKVTLSVNSSTHRPNYLIVQWGSFIRDCVMESANITYTLFSSEGIPLRAKIAASFIDRKESKLNSMASMLSSPDLTHTVEIKEGDLLSLLTFKIYRDQKYYLQVARVNRLKNFRKLQPGSKIHFPPLS
jgi:nucleoid-associated protein YgaU